MKAGDYDGRFSEPPYNTEETYLDVEAIEWAYQKLTVFGLANNTQENAVMMNRLNAMLD